MDSKIVSIAPLPEEILATLPEVVRIHIRSLESLLHGLQQEVDTLKARLSKDSSNSSKPPSSDGLKRKTKSSRQSSAKKAGGQEGHKGTGLARVDNPDFIVPHVPSSCTKCGTDLTEVSGCIVERRQVFDIPQPTVHVTEHQVEEKKCPCCSGLNRGSFPENVKGPTQYGNRIRALVAYFSHQHFIPVDRVCEIFEDIFDVSISPGTCANIDEQLYANLEVFEKGLKTHLLAAPVLHFDETGMKCEKKLHWVHVASSQTATFYMMHAKRGQKAMEAAGILSNFHGIAIHDHWQPYFAYDQVKHGLCNAHHLRELTFIHEQHKEGWAKKMHGLLVQANLEVEKYADLEQLPPEIKLTIHSTYSSILEEGFSYHASLPSLPTGKRGKQKQRDGKNLLDRLKDKRDCVLRFLDDFRVPFTNNQGERDIRMVKLKQKISGCFRAFHGGEIFLRTRSYISTAKKQEWNVWDALTEAISGIPRLLSANALPILQSLTG